MKKWFKIGEVAKLYHIGADALRYYEERGLLNPMRDKENNYRLYGVDDICTLNTIRDLRRLQFSTEQIAEALATRTLDSTIALLGSQREMIKASIEELQRTLHSVEARLEEFSSAQKIPLDEIIIKPLTERRCYIISESYMATTDNDMPLMRKLVNFDPENIYIIGSNRMGSFLDAHQAAQIDRVQYKGVFVFSERGDHSMSAGEWLTICYKGTYRQTRQYVQRLLDYAVAHKLQLVGDLVELLWVDQHATSCIEEFITELQIQIMQSL